jgi:hypothetical protein
MTEPASPISAPAAPPVGFLVELDNTWSAYRLYGKGHPAFARRADAAVAALTGPLCVSINSKGFHTEKGAIPHDDLLPLARHLRTMGIVGLEAQPPLTAAHVTALVLTLEDCSRTHAVGEPVAARIAAATGQRVKGMLLRLGTLHLVSGASRTAGSTAGDPATILTDLFFDRLGGSGVPGGSGGEGDGPGNARGNGNGAGDPAAMARSFENAIRGTGSEADWKVVLEAWNQGLLSIEPPKDGGTKDATVSPKEASRRLQEVAAFLRSLSPMLCQRLLSGTVNHHATPAAVALALIERLPLGIVLGALSEVDRSSSAPSAAAVAVLRKIAANVTPGQSPVEGMGAPRDTAQLAEIAATLQRLLGADQEDKFVPTDYFNRRQELSADALAPQTAAVKALVVPSDLETAAHAARLAFAMLGAPDAHPAHLASGLEFLKNHLGEWVRGGQFSLAEQGMELAKMLRETHSEPQVAEAAGALLGSTLDVDVLMEGSRHSADPRRAVADIVKLLAQNDGAALVSILSARRLPSSGGSANVVLEAVRKYLPVAPDGWISRLFGNGQTAIPAGLAGILATTGDEDAYKVIGAILPRCATGARRALAEMAFRRKGAWPVALIARLLKDAEPGVRRLAVMRCVRDADLATAATFLAEASDSEPYAPDVAVGLSDLLHVHRRHADVRSAYRRWFWSRRRWASFFSFSVSLDHGRRAA